MLLYVGLVGVTFGRTSCGKGIQEEEPGQEYFCGKADLKVSCGIKRKTLVVHVGESKNNRLHQTRRVRNGHQKVLSLLLTLQRFGRLWKPPSGGIYTRQKHPYHAVLGLLCHFSVAHSRLGTPELGMASLMIHLSETALFPDTSRVTLQIGGNWVMVQNQSEA